MHFIHEPGLDTLPVPFWRAALWRFGVWLVERGDRCNDIAGDRCEMCGYYKNGRRHDECDGIPF